MVWEMLQTQRTICGLSQATLKSGTGTSVQRLSAACAADCALCCTQRLAMRCHSYYLGIGRVPRSKVHTSHAVTSGIRTHKSFFSIPLHSSASGCKAIPGNSRARTDLDLGNDPAISRSLSLSPLHWSIGSEARRKRKNYDIGENW